ncbi:uncharacterized protein [Dermacentor andersoni]|uniref:uncharacterized protein isoform X1 n=1 Tax=Dermacentor andersoni TaxID=34620 RepID=UPI0024180C08|nr:uncharacterized protein LOC126537489 isoform X1 [Dermacentor andersoni]
MRLLSTLLVVSLLLLWTGSEAGFCLSPCPAHCSAERVVYVRNNTVSTEEGPRAKIIAEIALVLQQVRPGVRKSEMKFDGRTVAVPVTVKDKVEKALKKFPELANILLELVISKVEPPRNERKKKSTPKPRRPPPVHSTPPKPRHPPPVRSIPPKPRPPPPVRSTPPKPLPPPPVRFTPPKLETVLPDVSQPIIIPPTSQGVRTEAHAALELLLNFPNHSPTIIAYLVKKGAKFSDFTKPINSVTIGSTVVRLPRPLKVGYKINIDGRSFHLPQEAKQFAGYVGTHQNLLTVAITLLRPLGTTFTVDRVGKITSFEIFGKKQSFTQSLGGAVFVKGKKYDLPKDIKALLNVVKNNPTEFFKIQMLLKAFGVRYMESSGRNVVRANYGKDSYDIPVKGSARITLGGLAFSIPADLERIFETKQGLDVGAVLQALQLAHVPLNVERDTGIVKGVVVNGETIPFPVALDLRFKLYGKQYVIPRDLAKIVRVLEEKNMPSDVLSILYSHYGVSPVLNANKVVTALSFNNFTIPVKARPMTTLVIAGVKLLLPRDADKMYDLMISKKITPVQLLQALQLVGYTFVPGPDGTMQTIQKGAERIKLNFALRLYVVLNDKEYRVPNDLPPLVDAISRLKPKDMAKVIADLNRYGAVIAIKGTKAVIMLNGMKHEVSLKSRVGTNLGLIVHISNRTFNIPKDLKAIVSYANSKGAAVMQLLVELFKSHGIKVNQSPKGLILSILMDGKLYSVNDVGKKDDGSVQVQIRGKMFWIPREMLSLSKKLKGFRYVELLVALIRMGAKVEADKESHFYGFRFKGRLMRFPKKFHVAVKVDRTGAMFRVPAELGKLAKTLSKGEWHWDEVRKTLNAAGVEVAGKSGPIKSFSFQGQTFSVKK